MERKLNPTTAEFQAYSDSFSEHTQDAAQLREDGYSLFFRTALSLPNAEAKPGKHWASYHESEMPLVDVDYASLDARQTEILQRLPGLHAPLGFKVGIFEVKDDRKDAHKGIYSQSANLVVQSRDAATFGKRIVFHLKYDHSVYDWFEGALDYTLYGLSNDDAEKMAQAGELDLLLWVNNLAQIYSERAS